MTHRCIGALLLGGLVSLSGTGAFFSPTMTPPSWGTARYAHRARAPGRGVRGRDTSRGSSSPNEWCSTAAGSYYSHQRGLGRALKASLCGARYGGGIRHWQRSPGPLQSEAGDEEQQGLGLEETEDGNKTIKRITNVDEGGETTSGIWKGLRRFWGKIGIFGAGKKMPNIKQLGLYALLSYGFVSNISYVTCVSMAWFTTSKKTGLSPLAPGQRQIFWVSYAAFFAINNVLRVPRFALSMSLAPAFDRLIAFIMRVTGRGKTFGTALCVFFVNILGTLMFLSCSILLASLLSGVPIWSGA